MQNKRRFERVSFLCKLEIDTIPPTAAWPARSLDLSLGGVGLLTQASFQTGEMVTVSFFLKDPQQREVVNAVPGRVAHMAADTDGNKLGIEFIEVLDETRHGLLTKKLMSI